MFKIANIAAAAATASTLAALSFAPVAHAAGMTNGNFAAGLAGWSVAGNADVDAASAFGAPAGGMAAQAVMGTAATAGFLFGGSVVNAAALTTFAGLPAGTLAGLGGTVGSAISQSFTSGAGDLLSFSWKFMSDEPQASVANDTAFMVLDGVFKVLTNVQTAAFNGSSLSPMLDETPYKDFSTTLNAGNHTLTFGVFDAPDAIGASALAISRVALQPVPEPQTWALMLAGTAALGRLARRRIARA